MKSAKLYTLAKTFEWIRIEEECPVCGRLEIDELPGGCCCASCGKQGQFHMYQNEILVAWDRGGWQ